MMATEEMYWSTCFERVRLSVCEVGMAEVDDGVGLAVGCCAHSLSTELLTCRTRHGSSTCIRHGQLPPTTCSLDRHPSRHLAECAHPCSRAGSRSLPPTLPPSESDCASLTMPPPAAPPHVPPPRFLFTPDGEGIVPGSHVPEPELEGLRRWRVSLALTIPTIASLNVTTHSTLQLCFDLLGSGALTVGCQSPRLASRLGTRPVCSGSADCLATMTHTQPP